MSSERTTFIDNTLDADFIVDGERMWLSVATGSDDRCAAKRCIEHHWSADNARRMAADLASLVNRANHLGRLDAHTASGIRRLGALLFDELLPKPLKATIRELGSGTMTLGLPPALLDLPWELLHDGREFLALNWAVGRQVLEEHVGEVVPVRPESSLARILVVADPKGDLPEAYNEGVLLRHLITRFDGPQLTFQSTRVRQHFIKEHLRDFDLVHYAGHIDPNGLQLVDGSFGTHHINVMAGGLPMPKLVYLNGCGSADAGHSGAVANLARSFIRAGVSWFVGALYELPDPLGRDFAVAFYTSLASGLSVGRSLLEARRALTATHGLNTMLWAPYVLYGNPNGQIELFAHPDVRSDAEMEEEETLEFLPVGPEAHHYIHSLSNGGPTTLRAAEATGLTSRSQRLYGAIFQAFAVTAVFLLVGLGVALWSGNNRPPPSSAWTAPAISVFDESLFEPEVVEQTRDQVLWLTPVAETVVTDEASIRRVIGDGDTLLTGDDLTLSVFLSESAFIYVFRTTDGRVDRIWPTRAEDRLWIDNGSHQIALEVSESHTTVGATRETYVVTATPAAIADVDAVITYFNDLLAHGPNREAAMDGDGQTSTRLLCDYIERHDGVVSAVVVEHWPR